MNLLNRNAIKIITRHEQFFFFFNKQTNGYEKILDFNHKKSKSKLYWGAICHLSDWQKFKSVATQSVGLTGEMLLVEVQNGTIPMEGILAPSNTYLCIYDLTQQYCFWEFTWKIQVRNNIDTVFHCSIICKSKIL